MGLSRRVNELEKSISYVTALADELKYTLAPIDRIVNRLASRGEYAGLSFAGSCARLCSQGLCFEQAFSQALSEEKTALKPDDLMALTPLSQVLGAVDIDGQLSALAHSRSLLSQRLEQAREERRTYSRLYSTLGLLSGAAIAIVLI